MALIIADRVQETTLSTGASDYTLLGAKTGFQSFGAVMANSDTTYYAVTDGISWEVGIGTYSTTGPTMARTTILASSNGGSLVSWPAGSKDIFLSYAASKSSYLDASGYLLVADRIAHTGDTDTAILFPAANTVSVDTGGTERFRIENSTITTTVPVLLPADPTLPLQAATKEYVDTIASAGIHYHAPVRVESPINLNATYNNGTSGVGATLTNAGTQAALVIDGITVATNDRVLVYQQTDQTQNGVYVVTNTGSVSTNWVLTRSADADSYGPSDPDALGAGDAFFVQQGNTGAGELYVCNTPGTIVFGTTNITFVQIAATAVYTAGTGISLTNNVITNTAPDQTVTLTQGGVTTITGTYPNFTISTLAGLTSSVAELNVLTGMTASTAELNQLDTNTFTSAVAFPAGSVSNPAIYSTGDTNTGIFFPAADTIAFTEGGVEAMRINSSGFVGIGTTSPAQALSVNGSIDILAATTETRQLQIGQGRTGDGLSLIDFISDATYTDFGMRISRSAGENGTAFINVRGTGGLDIRTTDAAPIFFRTTTAERMRITATGNVGIGKTNPTTPLDVNGSASAVFFENPQTITSNYTIASGKNAMNTGPITIASGVTVTVSAGSRYVVI